MTDNQLPPCPVCGAETRIIFSSYRTCRIRCREVDIPGGGHWHEFDLESESDYRALCAAVEAGKRVPELEKEITSLRACYSVACIEREEALDSVDAVSTMLLKDHEYIAGGLQEQIESLRAELERRIEANQSRVGSLKAQTGTLDTTTDLPEMKKQEAP